MSSFPISAAAVAPEDPVTMFQPMRPSVKWSSVVNRRALAAGGSTVVEVVTMNPRFRVTAASALITGIGSP